MDVKQCYQAFEGDYADAMARLRSDERIIKFLKLMLNDDSFALLERSIGNGNVEEAFRAAHTLKGVCMSLALTKLFRSTYDITEALRNKTEISAEAKALFNAVKADYCQTVDAIKQL